MVAIGSDDKKKIYILLGLAGILAVLVVVVVRPFGSRKAASRITTTPTAAGDRPGAGAGPMARRPGGIPGEDLPTGVPAATGATTPAAAATGQPVQLINARSRPDPFEPFYSPTLPPREPIPGPLDIPRPDPESSMPSNLPKEFGEDLDSSPALVNLPPVRVPGSAGKTGPSILPPTSIVDTSLPERSPNKRLSGVVLGDSIYALIEISTADETISRVVQPGDEVEGIKILKIERVNENGEQRTRMTVMEGGQLKYFDLQAAPQGAGAGGLGGFGGPGGLGGPPGLPGGLPGRGAPIRPMGGRPPLP